MKPARSVDLGWQPEVQRRHRSWLKIIDELTLREIDERRLIGRFSDRNLFSMAFEKILIRVEVPGLVLFRRNPWSSQTLRTAGGAFPYEGLAFENTNLRSCQRA